MSSSLGSVDAITLFVGDVERAKQFYRGGPTDRPWGMRTAAFADPDGHIWEMAQDLPR